MPHLTRSSSYAARLIVLASSLGALTCSGSPTTPASVTPTPPNTPPVITSLVAGAAQVEANHTVTLTAAVQDAETPVNQLTYQWSATTDSGASSPKGSFVGQGSTINWLAPVATAGGQTPATFTLTLTVIENYTAILADGTKQNKQNQTSSFVTVHYNDSPAEISKITLQFLADFANSSVSPDVCLRNFSDSCPGKAAELADVQSNRVNFVIVGSSYSITNIFFNSAMTGASINAPCSFTSTYIPTGMTATGNGLCTFTTVYESFRWWLCDSHYSGFDPMGLFSRRLILP